MDIKLRARGLRYALTKVSMALSAARLGASLGEKIRMALLVLRLAYRRGSGKGAACEERLQLRAFGQKFWFNTTSLFDLRILKDVFLDGEYEMTLREEPRVILDVGGNVGVSALYFALKYPKASVYVFEPDPQAYKQLIKNISPFSNIKAYSYAVTDADGPITFYSVNGRSESSSLQLRPKAASRHTVTGRTITSILQELGLNQVDILKFDIEGGEWALLSSIKNFEKLRTIIGEVHLDLLSVDKKTFLNRLSEYAIATKKLSDSRFIFYATRHS